MLVPTAQFVRTLTAARLAADVLDVPTVLVARTDALSATLLTSDVDEYDRDVRHRRADGGGLLPRPRRARAPRSRASLAYAPYADLLWFETSTPDLGEAREFARGDPRALPGQAARLQLLAVVQLAQAPRRRRDRGLPGRARRAGLPLPVHHARRLPLAERGDVRARARLRASDGMTAYVELQEREFALEEHGYTATRHQREVGAGYFDLVAQAVVGGQRRRSRSTGSTEEAQFDADRDEPSASSSCADEDVLSPEALDFVARLHRELNPSAPRAARARHERQAELDAERSRTSCPRRATSARPTGASRRRRPTSATAAVEITGPVERKMMINALNSGARVFMADFEDALLADLGERRRGPAERHRRRAPRRSRSRPAEKSYRLNDETATLLVRPRGWHLPERHVLVDGEPVSRQPLRLRPRVLPQRAGAARARQRARTSTCRSSRATSRRGSGTTRSRSPRTELGLPHGSIRAPC